VFMARPEDGLRDVEESLELSRTLGHPEGESYALWHRAEALAALGRAEEAIASASEALAIAERIGHREWTVASLRGLGIAHEAAGDLETAAAAHRRGLEAAEGIPLFVGWAAARLATCLIGLGRLHEAPPLVERALAVGSPLIAYEARLADAELRAARGDPEVAATAAEAAALAEAGGHLVSLPRLRELASGSDQRSA
jgi:tetratricopeptide (TPR) repeat protein